MPDRVCECTYTNWLAHTRAERRFNVGDSFRSTASARSLGSHRSPEFPGEEDATIDEAATGIYNTSQCAFVLWERCILPCRAIHVTMIGFHSHHLLSTESTEFDPDVLGVITTVHDVQQHIDDLVPALHASVTHLPYSGPLILQYGLVIYLQILI